MTIVNHMIHHKHNKHTVLLIILSPKLNLKHRSPHRLERSRITEVVINLAMLEFKDIVDERRDELSTSFVSVTTDFWTNPHQKDAFGARVADVIVLKYTLANGTSFSMSTKTAQSLGEHIITVCLLLTNRMFECFYLISYLLCIFHTGQAFSSNS